MLLRKSLTSSERLNINEIIDFSIERGYRPFIVILPVCKKYKTVSVNSLSKEIIDDFENKVPILNYAFSTEWSNISFYIKDNYLNQKKSEEFTAAILKDITAEYENKKVNKRCMHSTDGDGYLASKINNT